MSNSAVANLQSWNALRFHRQPSIEIKDLHTFLLVAEIGSFRGAAAELKVEPSAISRRMRSLEDRLGASLFERNRSGVRLTTDLTPKK